MILPPDPARYESSDEFNSWIDSKFSSEFGDLKILGESLRASEVVHRMKFDAYRNAFSVFKQEVEASLIQDVINFFPIPIAHPFYRFLHGSENEIQRLQFLRDTWEGLVNFVHAMVVCEARAKNLTLAAPALCRSILTESLTTRITSIGDICLIASSSGSPLSCSVLFDVASIEKIRSLNQTRNAFSHTGAVSEAQATQYISDCLGDVFEILHDFSALKTVKILKVDRIDGLKMRYEKFEGHSKTKSFSEKYFRSADLASVLPLLVRDEFLINYDSTIINARPFFHFTSNPAGHVTQVAVFKKTRGTIPDRKMVFEVVGEAEELEFDRTLFQSSINEIRSLFGEQPE